MKKVISVFITLILIAVCVSGMAAADNPAEIRHKEKDISLTSSFSLPNRHRYTDVWLYGREVYAVTEDGQVDTANLEEKIRPVIEDWTDIREVFPLDIAVFGLHKDGTVSFCMRYSYPDIEEQLSSMLNWNDITALSGVFRPIGLKSNGTLVSVGIPGFETVIYDDFSGWTDVVKVQEIRGVGEAVIALCSDGTVLIRNGDAISWHDAELSHITDFSCAPYLWLGLKEDGTVQANGAYMERVKDETEQWTDIMQVAAGLSAAGVRKDSTVVTAGWFEPQDLSDWKNIRGLVCDLYSETLIGICDDGSVRCCIGRTNDAVCANTEEIGKWTEIKKVCIGRGGFAVGLKSDGSLVGSAPCKAA